MNYQYKSHISTVYIIYKVKMGEGGGGGGGGGGGKIGHSIIVLPKYW